LDADNTLIISEHARKQVEKLVQVRSFIHSTQRRTCLRWFATFSRLFFSFSILISSTL
jgi:hypothetical protein